MDRHSYYSGAVYKKHPKKTSKKSKKRKHSRSTHDRHGRSHDRSAVEYSDVSSDDLSAPEAGEIETEEENWDKINLVSGKPNVQKQSMNNNNTSATITKSSKKPQDDDLILSSPDQYDEELSDDDDDDDVANGDGKKRKKSKKDKKQKKNKKSKKRRKKRSKSISSIESISEDEFYTPSPNSGTDCAGTHTPLKQAASPKHHFTPPIGSHRPNSNTSYHSETPLLPGATNNSKYNKHRTPQKYTTSTSSPHTPPPSSSYSKMSVYSKDRNHYIPKHSSSSYPSSSSNYDSYHGKGNGEFFYSVFLFFCYLK